MKNIAMKRAAQDEKGKETLVHCKSHRFTAASAHLSKSTTVGKFLEQIFNFGEFTFYHNILNI